jgi:transcriptional regulator with XRE-family HTH domain
MEERTVQGRQKRSRATPKRKQRQAAPGTVFPSDVLTSNMRAHRLVRGLTQEDVGAEMARLGHEWSAGTVGFAERGDRTLSVDELVGLAIVLTTGVTDLLDPRGIDGRETDPVDYGDPARLGLPVDIAGPWMRGQLLVEVTGPGTFALRGVPGHEDAFERASESLFRWNRERLQTALDEEGQT